jgi:hypothetical protein
LAQEALSQRQAEVAGLERALTATEQAFDAGEIDGRQYNKREARLTGELDGAQNALKQAQKHVQELAQVGPVGDAEQVVLDLLAALKEAAAATADNAPDLPGLRNGVAAMFEAVHLCRADAAAAGLSAYKRDGMMWGRAQPPGGQWLRAQAGPAWGVRGRRVAAHPSGPPGQANTGRQNRLLSIGSLYCERFKGLGRSSGSEPRWVPNDILRAVVEVGKRLRSPSGSCTDWDWGATIVGGIERDPCDDDPRVRRVGVDRDPSSATGEPVALEAR